MKKKVTRHHLDRRAKKLIAEIQSTNPDELLNTRQLAEWLSCSESWLEIARCKNFGPNFIRMGPRNIRYRRRDVIAWLNKRAIRSATGRQDV